MESLDYWMPNNDLYKEYVARQGRRKQVWKWIMMGLIGFAVGLTSFLVKNSIQWLNTKKYDVARDPIEDDDLFLAWLWVVGFSLMLVFVASGVVVFFRPQAAGSGIPGVIAYLNGANVHACVSALPRARRGGKRLTLGSPTHLTAARAASSTCAP